MTDDDFLQEVDINNGSYFPQIEAEKAQAERLEKEGLLSSFVKQFPAGLPSQRLYGLTSKGKQRVPRYRDA